MKHVVGAVEIKELRFARQCFSGPMRLKSSNQSDRY